MKRTYSQLQAEYYDKRGTIDPARDYLRLHGFEVLVLPKDWFLKNLLSKADLVAGAKILDVGCGNAIFLDRVAQQRKGVQSCGIDVSWRSLRRGYLGSVKSHFLVQAEAQKLPFRDKNFDLVTSFDVMEHVTGQETMLSEMVRVLKPKGKIILYTLNRNNRFTWDWFFDKIKCDYLYRRALHSPELYLQDKWLTKKAKQLGLSAVKLQYYHGPFTLNWEIILVILVIVMEKMTLASLAVRLTTLGQRLFSPIFYFFDKMFYVFGWSNGFFLTATKR